MGADGRTAHDFFSKFMGGKIKNKNNGSTLNTGHLTKNLNFVRKKLYQKQDGHITFLLSGKTIWVTCPCLFFVRNGRFKKKTQWAHDGRSDHEKNKTSWASQNKTMGSTPFFESPFFRAHDAGIPISASPTKKNRIAHECALKKRATRTCKKRSKPILRCCFHFENMIKALNKKHEEAT